MFEQIPVFVLIVETDLAGDISGDSRRLPVKGGDGSDGYQLTSRRKQSVRGQRRVARIVGGADERRLFSLTSVQQVEAGASWRARQKESIVTTPGELVVSNSGFIAGSEVATARATVAANLSLGSTVPTSARELSGLFETGSGVEPELWGKRWPTGLHLAGEG